MADLKLYDTIDLAPVREYIMTHGERRRFRARRHFSSIGEPARHIGLVVSGGFAFSRPDFKGNRQILTMAFDGELIGGYITPGLSGRSGYDITALCDSEVFVVKLDDLIGYMDSQLPGYRLRFTLAVAMGFMMRGTSFRCDSPETRYRELLRRIPEINRKVSMTAIASYLGITRETFARLRNKLKTEIRDSDQSDSQNQSF